MQSFTRWKSMQHIVGQFPEESNEAFRTIGYTIGAMLVFPSNRVGGQATINGARGLNRSIADRLDLTLECIRRHYLREASPLAVTLDRYADFFALFGDFRGYVEFFLLDDLVDERGAIRFFHPFDGFGPSGAPKDLAGYIDFRARSIAFIDARNQRVLALGL